MSKNNLSPMEVNILKDLKVIRSDNPLLQRILDTYQRLILDKEDAEDLLKDADYRFKNLREEYHYTLEELSNLRTDHKQLKAKHEKLSKAMESLTSVLKEEGFVGEQSEKTEINYDPDSSGQFGYDI